MKSRSKNKILTKKKFKLDLNKTKINLHEIEQQWLLGEWEALIKTDIKALIADSTATLYLVYIAVAYQQLNKAELSKKYIKLALEKGCIRKKVIDILLASTSFNLARLALLKKEDKKARLYFEFATKTANKYFLADYYVLKEKIKLGLYPFEIIKKIKENKPISIHHCNEASQYVKNMYLNYLYLDIKKISSIKTEIDQSLFNEKSYQFYNQLSDTPFILLDSKSLPRSGLHYMKRTLEYLLKDKFSFCEWYYEKGCCKKMPCAILGYANQSNKKQISRLRLLKSHDFTLEDPIYNTKKNLQRIIIIRAPLFLLTSWFSLSQLNKYNHILFKEGINLNKVFLLHEPEIIASAYEIVDKQFILPEKNELISWLDEKIQYIINFINKWVAPLMDREQSYTEVVLYEDIDHYLRILLKDLAPFPNHIQQDINNFTIKENLVFKPRKNPFASSSKKLSNYLFENRELFLKATSQIYSSIPKSVYNKYFDNKF